jgi:NAD+ synthase
MTLFLEQRGRLSSAFNNVVGIVPSFLTSSVSAHRIRELIDLPREKHIPESAELKALEGVSALSDMAVANIAPRLRMTTLYTIGQSENRLVAGTGNRSEIYMGYFTKWGDGASDFNPIADLCASEVFEFLRYLNAPASIVEKAPSAGLYEGQTDEKEMGVTYRAIDGWLLRGEAEEADKAVIDRYHSRSEHKRRPISTFDNP